MYFLPVSGLLFLTKSPAFHSLYPFVATVVYSVCILITCVLLVNSLDYFIARVFSIVSSLSLSV